MSLSTALSSALSGLNASSRETELVSSNIANANTPDYTRRVAELGALTVGGQAGGVRVDGVRLVEDPYAVASRRRSDAELAAGSTALQSAARLADALGEPGDPNALATRAAAFETALLAAADDPSSGPRLADAVTAAGNYAGAMTTLSTETQRLRMDADAEIAAKVSQVNSSLKSIEMLNREIQMISVSGGDASALVDQRKALIDEISGILPIRARQRLNGEVALYTANGATLLDGSAATLGFTPTPTITQDMTLASGALSGLTLNGRPVSVGEPDGSGLMDGGSLGALFAARDTTLPGFADKLDALAEDLVLRFQDAGIDPSRAPGDPGLFTDGGSAYATADRAGLAGRIELNTVVDPAAGGALYRLRDGLGAAAPGDSGNDTLLAAMEAAARAPRTPPTGLGVTGSGGIADLAAAFTGDVAGAALRAETSVSSAAAVNSSLRDTELASSGVDTDRELQKLLAVEKSYAANAMVLRTVDEMIQRLLEI